MNSQLDEANLISQFETFFKRFSNKSKVEKAGRMLYLITTCFNGLYRVNKKGHFNTPIGKTKRYNYDRLLSASEYLNSNDVILRSNEFEKIVTGAKTNDMVYLNPPYDSNNGNIFHGYTIDGFDRFKQLSLKIMCDYLDSIHCYFLLSNSNTSYIKDMYRRYNIKEVITDRNISSKITSRGKVSELLISNY